MALQSCSEKNAGLLRALRRLKVETGSLACFGCGYEHNCSTHGCAILREAIDTLSGFEWIDPKVELPPEDVVVLVVVDELQNMHGQSVYMGNGWACVVNAAERKIITVHGWYPFSALEVGICFYRYPPREINEPHHDV